MVDARLDETAEFHWPIRVYYEDTDVAGIVYHANYLRYFERARTEWLRARGAHQTGLKGEHGVVFVVAGMEIAFRQPARMDDELVVVTKTHRIRRASMCFSQQILRGAELLCTAEVRAGCLDAQTYRPVAFPPDVLKGMMDGN